MNTRTYARTVCAAIVLGSALAVAPVGAQGSPTEVRSVPLVRGPERRCRIEPRGPHPEGIVALGVSCDDGSRASCGTTAMDGIVPESDGPAVNERIISCAPRDASGSSTGLHLFAIATDAWEILGARLYATGVRNPPTVLTRELVGDEVRELVVSIPRVGGEQTEVLRLDLGRRELVPILSFESRRESGSTTLVANPEWGRFGHGTVLLRTSPVIGRDLPPSVRVTYQVARWDAASGRYTPPASCPDPRPLYEAQGWSDDGRHRRLLRISAPRLSAGERRAGVEVRYETTSLGWTWGVRGCPALLMRTRTVVAGGGAATEDERAVHFAALEVDARGRGLRLSETIAGSDARVTAALGVGGVCGGAADCCSAYLTATGQAGRGPSLSCDAFRLGAPGDEMCRASIESYRAGLATSGRPIPRVCEIVAHAPTIPPTTPSATSHDVDVFLRQPFSLTYVQAGSQRHEAWLEVDLQHAVSGYRLTGTIMLLSDGTPFGQYTLDERGTGSAVAERSSSARERWVSSVSDGRRRTQGVVSLFPLPARTPGESITISGTIGTGDGTAGRLRLIVSAAGTAPAPAHAAGAFIGRWEGGRPDPDEQLELELLAEAGALTGTLTVTSAETWRCTVVVVQPASATRGPLVSFRCVSADEPDDPIVLDETRCVLTVTPRDALRFERPASGPGCRWADVELGRRASP